MKRTAIVVCLGLASWTAQAAQDVPGWRVGAAASFSDFEWTDGDLDLIDDNTLGLKLSVQYRLNSWLGVEGAYHNTGDFEEFSTKPAPNDGNLELNFDGFSGALLGYIPIPTDEVSVYLKAGLYSFDGELSRNGTVTSTSSEEGVMAGAGAIIHIAERLGMRADLDWFDAEVGDLWSANLGLEYSFGGEKKAEPVVAAAAPPPPPPPPPPAPAPDADGDGVPDAADRCPNTPAGDRVDARGCSCDVTRQLQFAFGSAELTEADKVMLDEVAGNLIALGFVSGTIEGHTDSVGSEAFNQRLSEQRAEAVADYLGNRGIARGRLRVVGFGLSQPVADNATEEGRAENRRVVMRRDDCGPAGGSADEDSGEDN
ncbi:MAG: OmpA family protein [Gammaproteobacteria bacterium]|nr:MAG: OmpA family protein [Gammaproteobacteria bacterium]